ncbi:hypothetical protein QLX67_00335 [Balneolaceae bacterium ANBcel3]|nr:hypothetical protein [Balneolaceae bacterium ANBcel3]
MNYIIKLPPKSKRDDIIDAWVNDVLHDHNYPKFRATIRDLIDSGFNRDGVMFMFLHRTTHEIAKRKIMQKSRYDLADIAFGNPISLN